VVLRCGWISGDFMIKTTVILAVLGSVGGTISAFTWVPGAADSTRNWMNEPAVVATQELSRKHTSDMNTMGVEIATSLHRAIESADVRARIAEYHTELINLERDLRSAISPHDKESIRRSIERLDKAIERELRNQQELKGLTKAQIAHLIRLDNA